MIDPQSWMRIHQQDRELEMQAAHRASLVRGAGSGMRRSPTRPLGPLGRSVGRTLVRVGLWLVVAD
ncbi:MAG: hypothetical protein ACXWOW_10730 [Candidatus Limnocylindrales bacterium]